MSEFLLFKVRINIQKGKFCHYMQKQAKGCPAGLRKHAYTLSYVMLVKCVFLFGWNF